jgi:hypothetical protein
MPATTQPPFVNLLQQLCACQGCRIRLTNAELAAFTILDNHGTSSSAACTCLFATGTSKPCGQAAQCICADVLTDCAPAGTLKWHTQCAVARNLRFSLNLHACRAHDGWERYTSPGVLLYRGSPYSLTPPVLSLAGEVQLVLDRWALAERVAAIATEGSTHRHGNCLCIRDGRHSHF